MSTVRLHLGDDPCRHCSRYEDGMVMSAETSAEIFAHCIEPHSCTAYTLRESDGTTEANNEA